RRRSSKAQGLRPGLEPDWLRTSRRRARRASVRRAFSFLRSKRDRSGAFVALDGELTLEIRPPSARNSCRRHIARALPAWKPNMLRAPGSNCSLPPAGFHAGAIGSLPRRAPRTHRTRRVWVAGLSRAPRTAHKSGLTVASPAVTSGGPTGE